MAFRIGAVIPRFKRRDAQKDGQPSNLDERNSLTKESEPEGTTSRSDIKQEMLPENSYDIQPSDGDREGLLIKEQHSISERQPRKINEVPGDIRPLVPTRGTEKQPRKKDDVQPLDVAQQRPPPMEDDVQLSDVIHHEEPEATIQSPDGKQEISEAKGKMPDVGSMDAKEAEQTAKESEEIEKLRRELSESHSQIAELRNRCEAQSEDLEGSNSFLNTANKSSDTDVIQVLQRLNAEVQQHTSCIADCLAEYFEFQNVTTNPTQEQISAVQRASPHIGRILAESLGTTNPKDIPMLLQIAFQAYLVSALGQVASSWAFEPGYNAFIHGIYQRLRTAGEKLNVRMRPLFQLTRRKMVHRGASYFWTLVFARARSQPQLEERQPRIPR